MRKRLLLASLAILGVMALSACDKQEASGPAEAVAATRPASATDMDGWQAYLSDLVRGNLEGMTAKTPYMYFVPSGDDPTAQSQYLQQLDNVGTVVARTVLPGNLLAFGGPSSAKTANLITEAFKRAAPGSFDGVIVLFIGDAVDEQRVAEAVKPSGATYRFVAM